MIASEKSNNVKTEVAIMANKTPAELTELNAEALEKRKKEWLDKAREAEKSLKDSEAELKALQKKIADQKRTLTRAKKYVRMQCEKNLFNAVLKKLELVEEEKNCKTESDYKELLKKIKEQLNLIDDVPDKVESAEEPPANVDKVEEPQTEIKNGSDNIDKIEEPQTEPENHKHLLGRIEKSNKPIQGSYSPVKNLQDGTE